MINDSKVRKKLIALLPSNYRLVVASRVGCHPNTVYNVLHNEHENPIVEIEIFNLAKQEKEKRDSNQQKVRELAKQL